MTHKGQFSSSDRTYRASDLTVGDYANGMPNIRIGEMFGSFLRQLSWMIPLLIIGIVVAFFASKDFKRSYQGEGRILVQLGSEYVYESVNGNSQTSGLTLTPDHIVLNEIGLMKNTDIIARVTGELRDEFGEKRLAESQYAQIQKAGRDPVAKKNAIVDLYQFIDKNYVVSPKPKSSIVDMVFKHEDPDIAVRGINLFINAYMDARKDVFVEGSSDVITERRMATEDQLATNENAIQKFMGQNRISDFDSEIQGAKTRTEALRSTLDLLRAQMSETEAALATVETQLRATPAEIDLFVDDRASQRIAQAELELQQLLAKYLPTAAPVTQKREELRLLQQGAATNSGRAAGGRRVGPNTVYQALLTRRNTLQSAADSFREKEFIQQRQLDAADAKVKKLNALLPKYTSLIREQSTLDTRLRSYTSKEQEALINQQQAQADSENVRVISISDLPRKGRNMRMIMFAVFTVAWGFTVLMLGLLKVFLDPKLYAPSANIERAIHGRRSSEYNDGMAESYTGTNRRGGGRNSTSSGYADPSYSDPRPQPFEPEPYYPQQAHAQGGGYMPPMDGNAAYDYDAYAQPQYDTDMPYTLPDGMPSAYAQATPPYPVTPPPAVPAGQHGRATPPYGYPGHIPASEDG